MEVVLPQSVRITYRHVQRLGARPDPGAITWGFEATAGAGGVVIARGGAVMVDLFGPDPYSALGRASEHIRRIRDVAFNEHTREPDWSWGDDLDLLGDQLLVLDELTINPGMRARGFTALINGMVITQLRHCVVAALYSANAQWDGVSEVVALRRGGLNLRPVRDGVHYIDPAAVDLDGIVRRLDESRSVLI
ncbi:MAG TPA: hypothetical protein VFE65_05720 [Pseudonocardia sp.]|jgi:hypothetical protein|nr:hypothetical protein [Pseudonocardia sp.]